MADNIQLNLGSGGDITRAEDVAGVKIPVIKIHNGAAGVDGGPITSANPLSVSGPITDTQIRATALPVSLASTTITGTVTSNATLSAETTKVIGTVNITAGQSIAANAGTNLNTSALNLEATQSAISAKLPAALGQGTMAQGLKVSLASDQSSIPVSRLDTTTSGSITAISQSVALTLNGKSGVALQLTGTWVGTIQFEGTVDGTNWVAINGVFAGASTPGPTITANGIIRLTPSGLAQVRATSTAWTSGTATVSLRASDATGGTFLNQSLTAGTNSIGTVQAPAITKGTQGTTGLTVQRLHDAGRNARHFILDAYTAAPAVEAVQSVVQWYGNAAVAATTQPAVVPAGKTLRLQSWSISTKSLATVGSAVVRIRINTAGLGVLASPLAFSFEAGSTSGSTTVAMTGGLNTITGRFPEGFEIPAGSGLAFSMAGYGPTGVLALNGVTRFEVHGYEY